MVSFIFEQERRKVKMNKSSLLSMFKSVQRVVTKHSPEILTGIGIAGMVSTTVLAVKATPKAIKLKDKAVKEKGEQLTIKETVKTCWKPYVPAAITGISSIGCLIGGSAVSIRRNAALVSAYKLSENALSEYRDKVIETVGETQEKVIRESVAKDNVIKQPPKDEEFVCTGHGDTKYYDAFCGRPFKSDRNYIERVVNILNRRMRTEMYISLNEFYRELGLDDVDIGDYIGWNIDKGYIDLDFGSDLINEETPCVTIHHNVRPEYEFDRL